MEQETNRRDASDMSSNMAILQQAQNETLNKLAHMQSALDRAIQELKETKASQNNHQNYITEMVTFLQQRFGIGNKICAMLFFLKAIFNDL